VYFIKHGRRGRFKRSKDAHAAQRWQNLNELTMVFVILYSVMASDKSFFFFIFYFIYFFFLVCLFRIVYFPIKVLIANFLHCLITSCLHNASFSLYIFHLIYMLSHKYTYISIQFNSTLLLQKEITCSDHCVIKNRTD
jgi:hypothetical protein